ncbi:MAG: hypothetical protein ACYDD2_07410 [Candidatus Acidiferrales bacterium]
MQSLDLCANDIDNCSDFLREQVKQLPDRCVFDSSWAGIVANAYHESRIVFVLHVKGRRINGESQDFAAVLNFGGEVRDRLNHLMSGTLDIDFRSLLQATCYLEQPVFIAIVEVSEKPEQWREHLMSSVVRLYPLNDCPHCIAQGLDSITLPDKFFVGVGDRELQNSLVGGRPEPRLGDSHGVNEMVKSGPQVVDEISENKRPSAEIGHGRKFKVDAVNLTVRIMILGENIRVLFFPSGDFIPDGVGVFLCTPNFEPAG